MAAAAAPPPEVSIDPMHQGPQLSGFDNSFSQQESANNGGVLSQDNVDRHHYVLKKELQLQLIIFALLSYFISLNFEILFKKGNLITEHNALMRFVLMNMSLYVINILLNLIIMHQINRENGSSIIRYSLMLSLFIWIFSCWGFQQVYSKEMLQLVDSNVDPLGKLKYGDVFILLQVMIWLRLGSVLLLITSAIIVLIVACCLYCFGCLDEEMYTANTRRAKSNVKKVNEFITDNQRLFNVEKDKELLDCCICLEEYKTHLTKEII